MIRFDNLTDTEQQAFTKCINKSTNKQYTKEEMELWPDDDEDVTKCYFKIEDKRKDGLDES